MDFLPEDRTIFRPADSLGEALREVARVIAPLNTAKVLQRRWKIDPHTAEKINQQVASGTTLVKAVRAEREKGTAWELWDALGQLLIGESRDEAEERKLLQMMESTRIARERLDTRRARRAALEARASEHSSLGGR